MPAKWPPKRLYSSKKLKRSCKLNISPLRCHGWVLLALFGLAGCSLQAPKGLTVVRHPTESDTLYDLELSYANGDRTYVGPTVSGTMLYVRYSDRNNDGTADTLIRSRTYSETYAEILLLPNSDTKFFVKEAHAINIHYPLQGFQGAP